MVYGMEIPISNNDVTKCSLDTIFGIMDFPFYENISSDSIFATTSIIAYDNNMERNSSNNNQTNFHNSDYLEWSSNDLKLSTSHHKTFLEPSDQNNMKFNHNNNINNQLDNENIDSSNIIENSSNTNNNNNNNANEKYNTSDLSNDANDTKVRMKITRKRKANNIHGGDNIVQRKMQFFNHNNNNDHQPRDLNDSESVVDPLATDESITKSNNTKITENSKPSEGNNTSRLSWQVNDITENLTADLDGSLSDLGADLTNGSYNMSDTLLQLPSLPVFKQEAPSPPNNNSDSVQQNNNINNISGTNGHIQHIQQQQQQQQSSQQQSQQQQSPTSSTSNNLNQVSAGGRIDSNNNQNNVNSSLHHLLHNYSGNIITNSIPSNNLNQTNHDTYARSAVSSSDYAENNGFQYVLAAATSIATKINEDTLTYLNQGQSYEIKLKKLGDLSSFKGKTLKSVIGICFHERRMQYGGRERLSQWQSGRPGDRVLEVDVPLSYGLTGLQQPSLNTVAFNWDPTTPVGVYIKVNCISTEFTEKKHGGERGIPLRIQVETYDSSKSGQIPGLGKRLHAGACQIKVFKLKGADRKHKQDREKIMKRPLSEQEKYQPSYDCTVLNDISYDDIIPSLNEEPFSPPQPTISTTSVQRPNYLTNGLMPQSYVKDEEPAITTATNLSISPSCTNGVGIHADNKQQTTNNRQIFNANLTTSSSAEETNSWLINNRFNTYVNTFGNFSGADILRLSRDDLIQICGLADGIRLYNALHAKTIAPKLILYVCTDRSNVFHAIYLTSYTNSELGEKLSSLIQASTDQIQGYFVQGPNGIHIHINDEVIRHFKNEAMYTVEIIANMNMNTCRILLKPLNP